jgi:hypothetical protein
MLGILARLFIAMTKYLRKQGRKGRFWLTVSVYQLALLFLGHGKPELSGRRRRSKVAYLMAARKHRRAVTRRGQGRTAPKDAPLQ